MFFSILKFWFFRLSGSWKGKKWPKMTKNSVCLTPYLRNHTSYDCDFWYTCVKWLYFQQIISFFNILIFENFRWIKRQKMTLTLSQRRSISYRNQSIDLQSKSIDWFLYDIGLRHERVKLAISVCFALYLRNCRSYHQDFDNDICKCFSFFLKNATL